MIGGALSSIGNGFINENVDGLGLKMASSAVLGGTISEIGGGKFANGAITGAYSMLFNDLMHGGDEADSRPIKSIKKGTATLQIVNDTRDAVNNKSTKSGLKALAKTIVTFGKGSLKVVVGRVLSIVSAIDGYIFYYDNIRPVINTQLQNEGVFNRPFIYCPGDNNSNGYYDSSGKFHKN